MQNPVDKLPMGPEGNVLQPNIFWNTIEKVLLNTSRDERKRVRHNMSAICHGYAISPQQPKKQPKKTRSTIDSNDMNEELGVRSKNSTDMKTGGSFSEVLQVGDIESYVNSHSHVHTLDDDILAENKPATTETDASAVIDIPDRNKDPQQDEKLASADLEQNLAIAAPRQTKSECRVEDTKVVHLKDAVSGVPYCERLWRFAIINRQFKNNFKEAFEPGIPSARSNEAIYKGLMQKLKEAKEEEEKINALNRKESSETMATGAEQSGAQQSDNKPKTKRCCRKRLEKLVNSLTCESASIANKIKNSELLQTRILALDTHVETSDSAGRREEFQLKSEIEAKKALYYNFVRKRLALGFKLQAIYNDVVCNRKYERRMLSAETARKYDKLKTDYMNICNQESSIRQQVSTLEAKMQNNAFQKGSAAVKTISLASKTAKLSRHSDTPMTEDEVYSYGNVLPFPRLKTPKPLIVQQNKNFQEKIRYRSDCKKINHCSQRTKHKSSRADMGKIRSEKSQPCFPCITKNVQCRSVLCTLKQEVPVKRTPEVLIGSESKCSYRLPKVNKSSHSRTPTKL